MRIGMTYDLRQDYLDMGFSEEETAEFDREATIAAIEAAIRAQGHQVERIGHFRRLVERLAAGDRWDLVFNIAEGLHGRSRESQVPAALEAYKIPYTFSDPVTLAVSLDKAITKRVIAGSGVPTPEFRVVEHASQLDGLRDGGLAYPLFVKPLAEGTGKGVNRQSVVRSFDALAAQCRFVLETCRQPALVETFMPGREFTVGIVGTGAEAECVGVEEVIVKGDDDDGIYSYVAKEKCEELVRYAPVDDAEARQAGAYALRVWRWLGCCDAGRLDFRSDERGNPHFLEVNPLAGLHPEHSDLPIIWTHHGRPYNALIAAILESAARRWKLDVHPSS